MPILGVIDSAKTGNLWPANSYYQIATTTVGAGGASDITFSSIPATYTHLQIRGIGRTARANVEDGLYFRFNGTTTGYNDHQLYGSGSVIQAFGNTGSDTEMETYVMPGNNAASGIFGVAIIDILDYANTNKFKTLRQLGGFDNNSTNGRISVNSGLWRNTNAITSVTLIGGNSTWVQYTQFDLYGIKVS